MCFPHHPQLHFYVHLFSRISMLKIIIFSSCEDSSIFVSSIIAVDKVYKVSLNVVISLVYIPCSHSVTRFLYMPEKVIENTTTPDCD